MATKKKRRRGRKHPGVVLLKPDAARRIWWRARYVDPDTGKQVKPTLPLGHTTEELREAWAVDKAKELAKRRHELEAGWTRKTGTKVAAGVQAYFDAHPQLRQRTVEIYRNGTKKLEAWAELAKVKSCDEVTLAALTRFRSSIVAEKKRVAAGKGKRGQYRETNDTRSPGAVNQELRAVRTALGYLLDAGYLPKCSHDDLRRGLKKLPVVVERAEHLKPAECKALIEAALRHDAAVFAETRAEHAGKAEKGGTNRYKPIARFVAFVLLTGMRFGEAHELDWSQVDLDALDHEGRAVGEIYLRGSGTKTHKARTVGVEVSPALRAMLAVMKMEAGSPKSGRVFPFSADTVHTAEQRLRVEYGAPASFNWQMLRRTTGTYLTNASGIFGAASAYRSAKQLGHSVQIAERHYVDVLRGIPRDARTIEAAMQIEAEMLRVVAPVRGGNVLRLVQGAS